MIKFYYNASPNPAKVALFLEEAELPYEVVPIEVRRGEQFNPDFLALNPNGKLPAIVDGDVTVFDSNAILLYLAEKTGKFLPENTPAARGKMLSWMMFVASGIGPYSGQAVHFKHFAPEPKTYAENRYSFEVERHYTVLDTQLNQNPFILGQSYTFVDMAAWGWASALPFVMGPQCWDKFPNVKRWLDTINARPAAARVAKLAEHHAFKGSFDDEARRYMFPQNARLVAA